MGVWCDLVSTYPVQNGKHLPVQWSIHLQTYGEDMSFEVNQETVGQFTGLPDKNGNKIFRGDIVIKDCYPWFDDDKPNYRGTVEWIYSEWQVVAHCVNPKKQGISDGINEGLNEIGFEDGEITDWEKIGNVYDNPELLRKAGK